VTQDPAELPSVGAALDAALQAWSDDLCLIESDRDQDRSRLTYAAFRERARPLAAWFRAQGIRPGDRIAIIASNQTRWHLTAYDAFHAGAVLVPMDFKLSGAEHVALLAHARPRAVVTEPHLWRAMVRAPGFAEAAPPTVVVTEGSGDEGTHPLDECRADVPDDFAPAPRRPEDIACVVYSSGTGGRPKGCLLTHDNYLAQFRALRELHPMGPGTVYLSILPTNHAIDFMVGFLGPYLCGAAVVHLRTLRPEFVRASFGRYGVTHVALVPLVLANLRSGLEERFAALSPFRRAMLNVGIGLHRWLGGGVPSPRIGRRVLGPVHTAFGGRLEAIFVGGAYSAPETLRFFHRLGIPVANGYGLTEAGTAITLDRLRPPRPETVGMPLPGTEVRIADPGADGIGEVLVRGRTVMAGYLDDPELTAETIVDGWLHTGDLGRLDGTGNLDLLGRRKNMIVTAGGKNVYPEDVEIAFRDLAAEESCLFAAEYLWPDRGRDERLILVVRPQAGAEAAAIAADVAARNRSLPDYQRAGGLLLWEEEFPRTASLKIKRSDLAARIGTAESACAVELP
jgi:long-chain acyl-CoA synthetase